MYGMRVDGMDERNELPPITGTMTIIDKPDGFGKPPKDDKDGK